ncbi:hypothetical protein [Streptomyces carpinensis]|uniref:RCK C-terminal domain-containing protein n=1 Tax=Streptomyces carpinensis TaxID=66369 RepID=A0ABV1WBU9_9ACTN|nr:hypothetical protein [Streptomyces carpinensis]
MAIVVATAGARDLLGPALRDLTAWLTRRPLTRSGEVTIGHSGALRSTVFAFLGMEVLVEALMDVSVVPPAWQPFHLVWMAVLVDLALFFAAVTQRNPHRLTDGALRIRAGLFDEIVLPLRAVESVRRQPASAPCRGVRPGPGSDGDVVCTVAGGADIAVVLREPVELRLRDGSAVTAHRLLLAADAPVTAHEALTRAVREAGDR